MVVGAVIRDRVHWSHERVRELDVRRAVLARAQEGLDQVAALGETVVDAWLPLRLFVEVVEEIEESHPVISDRPGEQRVVVEDETIGKHQAHVGGEVGVASVLVRVDAFLCRKR